DLESLRSWLLARGMRADVSPREVQDRLRLPLRGRLFRNIDRTASRGSLRAFKQRMHISRPDQRRPEIFAPFDYLAELPMGIILAAFPRDAIEIQEDAWPRATQELIDLAGDVADVDVRSFGIGHVDRAHASHVDRNVGSR